jgi:hypothetical protein
LKFFLYGRVGACDAEGVAEGGFLRDEIEDVVALLRVG